MSDNDLIYDDLVFSTTEKDFINVNEIQEPQNGKLIRGTFGTFSINEQNDD